MTKDEFKTLVKAMRSVYTQPNFFPEENLEFTMKIWYGLLKDIPYEVASAALMKHMSTSHFAPTPADIREAAAQASIGPQKDWLSGWYEVKQAVRRFGYMRQNEALDAIEAEDPVAARTARMLGWNEICCSENEEALRANFRMCYETAQKRQKEEATLPPGIHELLSGMTGTMMLEGRK